MSQEQMLQRLIKKVDTLNAKVDALKSQEIWVTAHDLNRLAGGLTGEQLRSIRENYPDWVRGKDDKHAYQYNWTALQHVYPSQKVAA